MRQEQIQISREEIKALISEGVQDAFTKMGVDVSNPIEMQKDMRHLRDWRVASDNVKKRGLLTFVTIIVVAAVGAVWVGIKDAIHEGRIN
jgi:hypothetical protein